MEGEKEEQGEIIHSHTVTQSCTEESNEPQNLQGPEEGDQAETEASDGVEPSQVEEGLCLCDAESFPQETPIATNTQDVADSLPLYPTATEQELTPPSVSPHPLNTQNRPSEPCWYCRRSLDSQYRPETPEQEDSGPLSPALSSDQKVSYQTDPRPHFGVACSSHSTCRPLWGSEGPCWGPRSQDVLDQTDTCPHCHLGLPPDTLRWHEAKCLQFEGVKIPKK
ncbi:uncharacterized protein AB9W97_009298 [Spinachia spinachia]